MAIAAGNNTSADIASAGATFNSTMPSGAGASSIVVFTVSFANDTGTAIGSWTPPTGWTEIGTRSFISGTTKPIGTQSFWSLGNNTNLTWTKSGSVKYVGWVAVNYTGVDLTTPIDATGTNANNTGSNTLTTNAVTIATDQAWHLIAAHDWNVAGGTFSATSFTTVQSPGPDESACLMYNTTPKGVGSTGTVVITATGGTAANNAITAQSYALRPASGGGGIIGTQGIFGNVAGLRGF